MYKKNKKILKIPENKFKKIISNLLMKNILHKYIFSLLKLIFFLFI